MQTIVKTAHGAQFKSQNRRNRFMRTCTPEATKRSGSIASACSDRVPELLHGSVFDPRASFPPVIVKNDRFIRSIAKKLMALVVHIKELLSSPGMV
jgi:hypothetical protein